jgi:predicted Zn-dependent protease
MKLTLVLLLILVGCGKVSKKSSETKQIVTSFYEAQSLTIDVAYEEGAEPYAGGITQLKYWDLLEKNIKALFEGRPKPPSVTVPKELNQMTKLSPFNKTTWSIQDVLNAAKTVAKTEGPGERRFTVLFLKGVAEEGPTIIGYHVNSTRVIAIFKDVVRSTSVGQAELVSKYVEQTTLIHEMGHALGLVNNGLPMITPHQDHAHGAHCNDPKCVMYYANEGVASLISFAKKVSEDLSIIMFDQHCLEDSRQF